jgi:hypothetical protein
MKTPSIPTPDNIETKRELNITYELPKISKKATHRKPVTFPTNINEYRHIIDTHKVKDNDLSWILFLRRNQPSNFNIVKNKPTKPPSFYEQDLEAYRTRFKGNSKEYKGNLNEIRHLLYNRIGKSPDITQTMYETNLRPATHSKDKWNNLPYMPRPIITPDSNIPLHMRKAELTDYSWRKYEPKFKVNIA